MTNYLVCQDRQGRTCLKVTDDVKYIPMEGAVDVGFEVLTTSPESFNQRYTPLPSYPVAKACQLYLNYCLTLGATQEVMTYLEKAIKITKEEKEMATTKAKAKAPVKKAPVKKAKAAAKKEPVKKAAAKAPAKKTVEVEDRRADERRDGDRREKPKKEPKQESAAQMFQSLIMSGKHTDEEIFVQVQAKHGLSDNKRSYVKWYRNYLLKQGKNPPGERK